MPELKNNPDYITAIEYAHFLGVLTDQQRDELLNYDIIAAS